MEDCLPSDCVTFKREMEQDDNMTMTKSFFKGSPRKKMDQIWLIRTTGIEKSSLDRYVELHKSQCAVDCEKGRTAILIYDLRTITNVENNWLATCRSFVQMHMDLAPMYDAWLKCVFIVSNSDVVCTTLHTVFSTMWAPTRPLKIVSDARELQAELKKIAAASDCA
tara:strand:+ start:896 stop:1393 length:498 start_codon:yes stop_codon:yes gene_type:complete